MGGNDLPGVDADVARFFFIILVSGICAIFTYLIVGD